MSKKSRILKMLAITASAAVLAAFGPIAAQANANAEVEAKVRTAFSDAPEMILVAKCESGFRQFAPDGSVLRGGTGKGYIGIFQIGERLHAEKAAGMGHDIHAIDGNIAYARYLYSVSGTVPWSECVPKDPAVATHDQPLVVDGLTTNLRFGMRHAEVLKLQRMLNAAGFVVTFSGGGSPGHETVYFGALTRDAVRRFQCAKGIACDGNEASTGYGRVGPLTRAALLQTAQLQPAP